MTSKALEVNLKFQGKSYIECPHCGMLMSLISQYQSRINEFLKIFQSNTSPVPDENGDVENQSKTDPLGDEG